MKIFPTRKTDDEFVENFRKNRKRLKWLVIPAIAICIVIIFFRFYFGHRLENIYLKISDVLSEKSQLSNEEAKTYQKSTDFLVGCKVGVIYSQGVYWRMLGLVICLTSIFSRRKDDLLIKYYDELKELQEEKQIHP